MVITRFICGATDWAPGMRDEGLVYPENVAVCNKAPGHSERWHHDIRDGKLWCEWSGDDGPIPNPKKEDVVEDDEYMAHRVGTESTRSPSRELERDIQAALSDYAGHTSEAPFPPSKFVTEPGDPQNDGPYMAAKENTNYPERARALVYDYIRDRLEKTDAHVKFVPDDVYTVWFCKVLKNWKALISTTLPDGMYYEVTYNGEAGEAYIDAYKKFENVKVLDSTLY